MNEWSDRAAVSVLGLLVRIFSCIFQLWKVQSALRSPAKNEDDKTNIFLIYNLNLLYKLTQNCSEYFQMLIFLTLDNQWSCLYHCRKKKKKSAVSPMFTAFHTKTMIMSWTVHMFARGRTPGGISTQLSVLWLSRGRESVRWQRPCWHH